MSNNITLRILFYLFLLSEILCLGLVKRQDSSSELPNTSPTNPLKLQIVYSMGFLDKDSGEFGGKFDFHFNKDLLKTIEWSLSFSFPNSLTQVLRFIGPIKFSHYSDGVHLISFKSDSSTQSDSLTSPLSTSFVAMSPNKPTTWDDIQIQNLILHVGPAGSSVSHKLSLDSDYFLPKQSSDLPSSSFGIYDTPSVNSIEDSVKKEFAALSKSTQEDSSDSSEDLQANGTYLVGTQYSLIIYSIVLFFGTVSYATGSAIRLRHRKRFRVEKLRRARTVAGYSRIM